MIRRIRKSWLCWKYHLCPVHGELMQSGGYAGAWHCPTCISENLGKSIQRDKTDHLARVRAQIELNRDWSISKAAEN